MKSFSFFCLLLLTMMVHAQKQTAIWYFGKNAGVDFSSGKPVAITNGALSTEEGCVSICDAQGKLLFYTDGITVWNANHVPMGNGTGLRGNPSSTQSGVVIPSPASPSQYYLFTVAATGDADGLRYSLVDMSLANGMGDVDTTKKNVLLLTPSTEKLTAVKHRNAKDIWVIAHEWKSDLFYAYLVSAKGISTAPVKSKIGTMHDGNSLNSQGYMKANPDGTNLALALEDSNKFELFDFDNATGKVSNPISISLPYGSYPYGVEFSHDGSIMYGSAAGTGKIYQWNLQAGSTQGILNSQVMVGESPERKWIGALQIASDGKIYFPIYNTSYLGVINAPEKAGLACGYQNNVVYLEGKMAQLGLPGFIQDYFAKDLTQKVTYFNETNVKVGQLLILKNITFEYAKYTLQASSYPELLKVVKVMKAHPEYAMELSGHTDNIGNKSFNIDLSKNRANAVKNYLVSQGIEASRITVKGFGSSMPVANNNSEAGRALNRRVEFLITE
ncbi:MAG: OmpA family protein [Cytophagaceae bacterium]|jgi:outer membrane protein OmpA-like peptidoglycan-associated protein|nr:OmpA family protein [Cytophagaceae bacterium]